MLEGYRILWVAGGRDFTNQAMMRGALREATRAHGYDAIITGAARGADLTAEKVWRNDFQQPYIGIPAPWNTLGKQAGYRRNVRIAEQRPLALLALPGGRGTQNARDVARDLDIPILE